MTDLTFVELFAGAGGLSKGLENAGWSCRAHAEIEPHARAVLRKHWPDVPLEGDVAGIDGRIYRGRRLISGGSPCQDISVAGKREGMTEGSETRSSLFFEQVRIWRESDADLFLWENVLGAFSSNKGRDFAAVLSSLVGSPIAVPADGWRSGGVAAGRTGVAAWRVLDAQFFGIPQRRRRVFVLGARAGGIDPAAVLSLAEGLPGDSEARGETGEGTPGDAARGSRATGKRSVIAPTISGGAHPGSYNGQDGAQIAEAILDASIDKHSGSASIGVTATLKTDLAHEMGPVVVSETGKGFWSEGDAAGPLRAEPGGMPSHIIMASGQANAETGNGVAPALTALHEAPIVSGPVNVAAENGNRERGVIAFDTKGTEVQHDRDRAPTLRAMPHDTSKPNGGGQLGVVAYDGLNQAVSDVAPPLRVGKDSGDHVLAFSPEQITHPENRSTVKPGAPAPSLTERGSLSIAFKPSHYTRGKDGKPSDVAPTLSADADRGDQDTLVFGWQNDREGMRAAEAAPSLRSSMGTSGFHEMNHPVALAGVPRRLLPLECERLQGWEDLWTAVGLYHAEDFDVLADEAEKVAASIELDEARTAALKVAAKYRKKAQAVRKHGTEIAEHLSDSARYRLCGNGVASPVAEWIGRRLAAALRDLEEATA